MYVQNENLATLAGIPWVGLWHGGPLDGVDVEEVLWVLREEGRVVRVQPRVEDGFS